MAKKQPTKKQMIEKIEAINAVNNMVVRHLDKLGFAFTHYIEMKGETAEFKKYLENLSNNSNLPKDKEKEANDGRK